MADEALQRGSVVESLIFKFDTKKDWPKRPGSLGVECNFSLTRLADLTEDILFVGVLSHLLKQERGIAKGAPGQRAEKFNQHTLPLEQTFASFLPKMVAFHGFQTRNGRSGVTRQRQRCIDTRRSRGNRAGMLLRVIQHRNTGAHHRVIECKLNCGCSMVDGKQHGTHDILRVVVATGGICDEENSWERILKI